jgi:hypothetical protein
MKNIFLLLIILMTFLSLKSRAGDMGVGLYLGQPTGVTAKKLISEKNAIDFGAGWNFGSNSVFNLFSDYLFTSKGGVYWNETPLDFYFGMGGRMKFDDEIELGVRIPLGLSAMSDNKDMEYFGEIAPIFDFVPKTKFDLNLGIGMRYYF